MKYKIRFETSRKSFRKVLASTKTAKTLTVGRLVPRVPRSQSPRLQISKGHKARVPRYKGPKIQWSQGPQYLKVTFKYKLDSKEGQSCLIFIHTHYRPKQIKWSTTLHSPKHSCSSLGISDPQTKRVDWQRKLIDEECQFIEKFNWQRKLIDEESWLMKKVGWWRKLIDEESWFTKKVDWCVVKYI